MDSIYDNIINNKATAEDIISAVEFIETNLHMDLKDKLFKALSIVGAMRDAGMNDDILSNGKNEFNYLGNEFLGFEEIDEYNFFLIKFGLYLHIKSRYAYGDFQYVQIDIKQVSD